MSNVYDFGDSAYLEGAKAVVEFTNSIGFTDDTKDQKVPINPVNAKTKTVEFVPWGLDNTMPLMVLDKIYNNITVASNIDFNSRINFGDGIMVVRKTKKDGKVEYVEVLDSEAPEIFTFLEDNNYNRILQENAADLATFYDGHVELTLDRNEKAKIVRIRQLETVFSRLSVMNKAGIIEYHGYSAKWGTGTLDDVVVTPFLDRDAPLFDLKQRLGLLPDPKTGKTSKVKDKRFVLSLALPTPGRFYYNKPYWWSIFKSGWFDFACAIPAFKTALIKNEMVLKYHIMINTSFWDKLFAAENITEDTKKADRKKQFLNQLNDFLSGDKNAGKSFVSHYQYDQVKGYEIKDIIIEAVPSFLKGGEYIEDSEEASNSICYAMGVHPSLQGASPGKGKTISGTEARELFIIKQAMTKPIRQALLLPLYLVKAINGWDKDIHFVIPNIMLTTLDKNTGAEKSIGNQPL